MHATPKIIEATSEHLPQMSHILSTLGTQTHAMPGETSRNDLVRKHFVRKGSTIADSIESNVQRYWVAESEGRMYGMGGYNTHTEQIHSIYILEQGRGIGSLMLSHIRSQPEVVANFSAWIADINHQSFAFFAKHNIVRNGNVDIWPLNDELFIPIYQVSPIGLSPSFATVDRPKHA